MFEQKKTFLLLDVNIFRNLFDQVGVCNTVLVFGICKILTETRVKYENSGAVSVANALYKH